MPTSLPSFKEILSLSLSLHIMYFSYPDLYVCLCGIIVHSHSHNHCTVGARVFYHRHQEFMGHGLCREDEFSWPTPFVSHRTAVSSSKLQTVVPSGLANIKIFLSDSAFFATFSANYAWSLPFTSASVFQGQWTLDLFAKACSTVVEQYKS